MKIKFLGLSDVLTFTEKGRSYCVGDVVEVSDERGASLMKSYPDGFVDANAEQPASTEATLDESDTQTEG